MKLHMKKIGRIVGIFLLVVIAFLAILPVIRNFETVELNEQTRKEAPGSFIELSQGFTHYEEVGSDTAETILLVHGFSVPYYVWNKNFDVLKNAGYHTIRFDLYGRGYSERLDTKYTKDVFLTQINDLLDSLHITKKIHIFGLSMGGAVVTDYVVAHPERIDKIVYVDPVHNRMDKAILKVPLLGKYLAKVVWAPQLAEFQFGSFYDKSCDPQWAEKFRPQMKFKGYIEGLRSTLNNYLTTDKIDQYKMLNTLNKDILLFWGRQDSTVSFDGSDRIQSVLDCEFIAVDSCGHIPNYEHPEIANPAILQFLAKK